MICSLLLVLLLCIHWYKTCAAAAKLIQLCPILCDPIDVSPPGSPVPGILQARTLEWVAIFFSNAWKWKIKVKSLSRVRLFVTSWIAARQDSLSITNSRSSLRLTPIESVMPSSHLILCRPLLLLPPIPPSISLFHWVNSLNEVAKVLEFQLYHHSFQRNPRADLLQNGLVGSPRSPRDSQESSPTPQFKSINSSALSLLQSPTLTSIHDYWKNHSLD